MGKHRKLLVGSGGKHGKCKVCGSINCQHDEKRDGKEPAERSRYAKKAARTRARNRAARGEKISVNIPKKLLLELEKKAGSGKFNGRDDVISAALREYFGMN